MSDGAGKGPRARPRTDATSVHRSTAGGLSARAAGGKGFGMLGHTGSHGRSMVAKVPNAGCIDHFNRSVTDGWGSSPTFIGAWNPLWGGFSDRLGVENGYGRFTCPNDSYTPWMVAEWPESRVNTAPGGVTMRFRRSGGLMENTFGSWPYYAVSVALSDGVTAVRCSLWYDRGYRWGDRGGWEAYDMAWEPDGWMPFTDGRSWTDPEAFYQGYFIEPQGLNENGGFWVDPPELNDEWWNFRMRVDDYGVYVRIWKDSQDEYDNTRAPGSGWEWQPSDVWGAGCPQGAGEAWTYWRAFPDVTLSDWHPTDVRVWSGNARNVSDLHETWIDDFATTGGFCRFNTPI